VSLPWLPLGVPGSPPPRCSRHNIPSSSCEMQPHSRLATLLRVLLLIAQQPFPFSSGAPVVYDRAFDLISGAGRDACGRAIDVGQNTWVYEGNTADGRPYYSIPIELVGFEAAVLYLYYDANCNGKGGAPHAQPHHPQWIYSDLKPSTKLLCDLDGDGKCPAVRCPPHVRLFLQLYTLDGLSLSRDPPTTSSNPKP
jgi:hypothetical protein